MVAWNNDADWAAEEWLVSTPYSQRAITVTSGKISSSVMDVIDLLTHLATWQKEQASCESSSGWNFHVEAEAAPPLFERGPDFDIPRRYEWPELEEPGDDTSYAEDE